MPLVQPPSPTHRVHFETTCVVIPEAPEPSMIHLEKRSYVLPTWRRQRSDENKEETHPPVITVRVPSISRKHRHQHSKERTPLQPCLRHSHSVSCSNVDGEAATAAAIASGTSLPPPSPSAYTSLHKTSSVSRRPRASEGDRIPLRECCTTCLKSVDQAFESDYHEHWSSGARRRRRMSESEVSKASAFGCSASFLTKPVNVDEVDARRSKKRPNVPLSLPPTLLPCADDDDESLLFPLPSPRRTPLCGTPAVGTPSATPPKASPLTPSPQNIVDALAQTAQERGKPLPQPPSMEKTGRALLAELPDVDVLPSRRVASESATTQSPHNKKASQSLFRTISPPSFGGW
ncbi:hypothetical protein CPB86DRAFT_417667 [Serendipita vermifera]|nr:hypothetical protein CPB86DRAFT_417667 [Serendipita vermifera]